MKNYFKRLKYKSMTGQRARMDFKLKLFAFFVLGFVAVFALMAEEPTFGLAFAIAPGLMAFAKKDEELDDDQKSLLGTIEKKVNDTIQAAFKGMATPEDVKKEIDTVQETLKSLNDDGKFGKALKEIESFQETLKNLGFELESIKTKGFHLPGGGEDPLSKKIDEFMDSQKFKDFCDGKTKSTGAFNIEHKDMGVVSMTGNYEGDKLITQQSSRVVTQISEGLHLRDLMMIDMGDPQFPTITFTQITDLDRNAASVSENGRLPESSFKMREETVGVCRIGTYVSLSKRLLRSRVYVKSWLLNRLRSWVRMAEDFQIMFGDGQGDNLKGITNYDNVKSASSIISDDVVVGAAGSVLAVSGYDKGTQTIIEFSAAQSHIREGQKITFSGSAEAELNDTFVVHKVNDRKIMIELVTPDIDQDEAEDISFTVKNDLFNSVEEPNIGDAVAAIFAIMTYGEYDPNFIAMNPTTIFQAETAKDTTGRSLGLVTTVNGVKYIAGRPIVSTSQIAPGKYFCGDLVNGLSFVDWTTLSIEFAEDVETKLKNTVTVIAQEEVQMPVYNPFSFAYGELNDVINAIRKV